jgi:hypothetical protein
MGMTYVMALPYVDPKDRACGEVCPVDVPSQKAPLGSPGGAAKLGLLATDTAMVAALSPREA